MQDVFIWWLVLLLIGLIFLPLFLCMFHEFADGGWLFAKTGGLFVSGWILWALNCGKLLSFGTLGGFIVLLICATVSYAGYFVGIRQGKWKSLVAKLSFKRILFEEMLFLLLLLLWAYIIGFRPAAYGTEKFMDYGFLTAMLRSRYMPFADPWYAGEPINYYYGGQYLTAYLIQLTGVTAGVGYNLMRATIAAMSFLLPYSLVTQMAKDRIGNARKPLTHLAGLVSGLAVAYAGNGHFIIYGLIKRISSAMSGTDYFYWFPDSTRYIGYNPDLPDKTIHEFPAYSTLLGDLHAHYINMIFVLTIAAVVYGWAQKHKAVGRYQDIESSMDFWKEVLAPEIILIGFMTGAFRWTNFWDFPIWFVVCGSVIFFVNLGKWKTRPGMFIAVMAMEAVIVFGVGCLSAIPFTSSFNQISSQIMVAKNHSLIYQLLILWGFPFLVGILFLIGSVVRARDEGRFALPDLVAFLFVLCAMGLVVMPEVIYVKDIYEGTYSRANTMFKLTYQAYILFGISLGYILGTALARVRIRKPEEQPGGLFWYEKRGGVAVRRTGAILGILIIVIMCGYTIEGELYWYGNITETERWVGLDADAYLESKFASDRDAIEWLNVNVKGQPVILEAHGASYSDYERVSVSTGLPTVIGWHTHEWLWRDNLKAVDHRVEDVKAMYTSTDPEEVKTLLMKYNVSYIYIGELERQAYENINDALLQEMGEVVYNDNVTTYIIKISK